MSNRPTDRPIPMVTSNWRTLAALHESGSRDYVPVRTSLGTPKFWPLGQHAPYVEELAPRGLLRRPPLPPDEFERLYLARLDAIGREQIERRLREVYAEYLLPLALLCVENVHAGQVCHRTMFAAWWEQETGQAILEL